MLGFYATIGVMQHSGFKVSSLLFQSKKGFHYTTFLAIMFSLILCAIQYSTVTNREDSKFNLVVIFFLQ